MVTLKEIREYALNSMSHYTPTNLNEYPYDMDGHCGDGLWKEIQEFWEDFKTDDDFKYLVSCEWASDEIDLEGGRSYLLDSKLVDICFDYMYNTLGWSKEKYQDIIHNTLDFSDEIEDKYDSISVKRNDKIDQIIKPGLYDKLYPDQKRSVSLEDTIQVKTNIWSSIDFDNQLSQGDFDYIPHVIKYPTSRKEELDTYESIDYIGKSRVDDNFIIYKIKSLGVKVPSGYEIVKPIEDVI